MHSIIVGRDLIIVLFTSHLKETAMFSQDTLSYAQHGIGFVGEAVVRALHKVSPALSLLGVDVDEQKVRRLSRRFNIPSCMADEIDYYKDFNIHSFSLPTPCDPAHFDHTWGYDLTCLKGGLRQFGKYVLRNRRDYTLVIIRSTVYPGTTEEILIPVLEEASGKRCCVDFDVVYNPEFLAQETAYQDALRPPLLAAAGTSSAALEMFKLCFSGFRVEFSAYESIREAEWLKVTNNVLNAMLISAVNELREDMVLSGLSRARAQTVIETLSRTAFAKTKLSYGLKDLGPWGGACLPKEVKAALLCNVERGIPSSMLIATQTVNDRMEVNQQVNHRNSLRNRLVPQKITVSRTARVQRESP